MTLGKNDSLAEVSAKGFVVLKNIGTDGKSAGTSHGGRVDISKEISDVTFTLSLTDATIGDYRNAPRLKDAILTADKTINSDVAVSAGYDFGLESPFASVTADTDVANKAVSARATWFHRGNVVRTEGTLKLDANNTIAAAYTFNDAGNLMNSTFINLQERNAFVIDPFTYPVATAAAKYTLQTHGYTIEGAVDLNRNAPYLSVQKNYEHAGVKVQYALKEEVALVEVQPRRPDDAWQPLKFYAKTPIGAGGVGPVSVGVIAGDIFTV